MKTTKIGKAFYIAGAVVLGTSILQWQFAFQDRSQLFFGVLMGINLIGWGYLHTWMRNKDTELSKLKKQGDNLASWYHKLDWGNKK